MLWCVLAIPLAILLNDIRIELEFPTKGLGADPEDAIVDHLGQWSLRLLWFTLFISSLARVTKRPVLIQFRRMAGLWAFFMVTLHVSSYTLLLARADLRIILSDFVDRPYIIAGLIALCSLVPLAITSTRGWRRRLRQRWKQLHRLIYVAALAGWVHLLWLERATFEDSVLYGVILALLFIERIVTTMRARRKNKPYELRPEMKHRQYWLANLRLVGVLLCIWFIVSFGCGILFVDVLNHIQIAGFKLGFWFAQQGSIVVFVILIFVYAVLANRLDRTHHVDEDT